MNTSIINYATAELLVVVRRYDAPEVRFGTHEYSNAQYMTAPQLMSESEVDLKIETFLAEGFEEIDPFHVSQVDAGVYQIVKSSLPIEFHTGWSRGDHDMCERIRIFAKVS